MLSDFEDFIALWRALAVDTDKGRLPTRDQITATEFHRFLPNMVVARWNTKNWIPQIDYCGTRIDQLLKRDVQQEPVKALLEPGRHMEAHLEIAKAVIKDKVGAEVQADVSIGGGNSIVAKQLRLPLAPVDGKPVIISLLHIPDTHPQPTITGSVRLEKMRYTFFELVAEEAALETVS
ncbi:MAG: PAS domain-containing protein [Kordiimonadaceae bacterium]|nr:PAS domain-containing protein [Kordiimonadaceae bacterium]MBO6569227.1 PAS domain-containing protein [Kordiimonadaceae bacterium]MBO6964703.1 PAS domain-containing protein [Kordiimonadaceae bacterium]